MYIKLNITVFQLVYANLTDIWKVRGVQSAYRNSRIALRVGNQDTFTRDDSLINCAIGGDATLPTTLPTTVPPTLPPTVPPTLPPTLPPTVPPTVPPTLPPTLPTLYLPHCRRNTISNGEVNCTEMYTTLVHEPMQISQS